MCTRQAALQLWLVFLNKSNDDAGGLARVLPYLAHGNAAAQAALLDHYTACLDLAAFDAAGAQQQQVQLSAWRQNLVLVLSSNLQFTSSCFAKH